MKYNIITPSGKYVLPTTHNNIVDTPFNYSDIHRAIEIWSAHTKTVGACSIVVCAADRLSDTLPVGCLFDGNLGHVRTSRRIIYLAMQYGYSPSDFSWADVNSDDGEALDYECDDAIEYLNQFVPDNCVAEWNDGDFIVSSLNSDDDEI